MRLLGKMLQRGPADLLLAVEALLLLALFRICLAVVPVRRIIGGITHGHAGDEAVKFGAKGGGRGQAVESARRVGWAVSAVARHSAVEFVCFPQALAGYTMLRWRGVPGTIVYGVARSPGGELMAHTWLTTGERMVLGGDASGDFTAIERWS